MKQIILASILTASSTFCLQANAASLVELNTKATQLINGASADIQYLFKNAGKCTVNTDRLNDNMLNPRQADLKKFKSQMNADFAGYVPSDSSCPPPSKAELAAGLKTVQEISSEIEDLLELTTTSQLQLLGMSVDEVMDMALSASDDPKYKNCKAQNASDSKSTPELKSYYAMKEKFVALKKVADAMAVESDLLMRGKGQPLCAKSASTRK